MISVKIDVTKIDKSLLYKGEKGTYLNLILKETPGGRFGDYMVIQDMPKERRENGEKGAILGNGKNFGSKPSGGGPSSNTGHANQYSDNSDSVPF